MVTRVTGSRYGWKEDKSSYLLTLRLGVRATAEEHNLHTGKWGDQTDLKSSTLPMEMDLSYL